MMLKADMMPIDKYCLIQRGVVLASKVMNSGFANFSTQQWNPEEAYLEDSEFWGLEVLRHMEKIAQEGIDLGKKKDVKFFELSEADLQEICWTGLGFVTGKGSGHK
jgi:hypothetical protein